MVGELRFAGQDLTTGIDVRSLELGAGDRATLEVVRPSRRHGAPLGLGRRQGPRQQRPGGGPHQLGPGRGHRARRQPGRLPPRRRRRRTAVGRGAAGGVGRPAGLAGLRLRRPAGRLRRAGRGVAAPTSCRRSPGASATWWTCPTRQSWPWCCASATLPRRRCAASASPSRPSVPTAGRKAPPGTGSLVRGPSRASISSGTSQCRCTMDGDDGY